MLTPRFEEALIYAAQLHAKQKRKQTDIPYIAHLLAVTSLVMENGGDEDEVIVALLHDAVEDQGGLETAEEIRRRFGEQVAGIVIGCSDTHETPKPPWRERKETYIAHLVHASPSTLLVSASDKLHNARAILMDYRKVGEKVWTRFAGGHDGTLWYYRTLVETYRATHDQRISGLVTELDRVVSELERLAPPS
jgi:GTP pyrophosphokinase